MRDICLEVTTKQFDILVVWIRKVQRSFPSVSLMPGMDFKAKINDCYCDCLHNLSVFASGELKVQLRYNYE